MKFFIKDFVRKCDQIRRKLQIWSHLLTAVWSHLLKKSFMKNFIFCAAKIHLLHLRNITSKSPSAFLFSVLTLGLKASAFTCPKSTIEKPEQCVNSFQSQQQRHQNDVRDIVLVSLFLTLNRFHRLFLCFNL